MDSTGGAPVRHTGVVPNHSCDPGALATESNPQAIGCSPYTRHDGSHSPSSGVALEEQESPVKRPARPAWDGIQAHWQPQPLEAMTKPLSQHELQQLACTPDLVADRDLLEDGDSSPVAAQLLRRKRCSGEPMSASTREVAESHMYALGGTVGPEPRLGREGLGFVQHELDRLSQFSPDFRHGVGTGQLQDEPSSPQAQKLLNTRQSQHRLQAGPDHSHILSTVTHGDAAVLGHSEQLDSRMLAQPSPTQHRARTQTSSPGSTRLSDMESTWGQTTCDPSSHPTARHSVGLTQEELDAVSFHEVDVVTCLPEFHGKPGQAPTLPACSGGQGSGLQQAILDSICNAVPQERPYGAQIVEEPSSPQAAQLRRVKRTSQGSASVDSDEYAAHSQPYQIRSGQGIDALLMKHRGEDHFLNEAQFEEGTGDFFVSADDEPSSPQASQLRRVRRSPCGSTSLGADDRNAHAHASLFHEGYAQERYAWQQEPSSPQAEQIRRAKRRSHPSGSLSSPSQQGSPASRFEVSVTGITQEQLDALSHQMDHPCGGETWSPEEPSSPQARYLVRTKRQAHSEGGNGCANSNPLQMAAAEQECPGQPPHEATPFAELLSLGQVHGEASFPDGHGGLSQTELNSLSRAGVAADCEPFSPVASRMCQAKKATRYLGQR